MSFITLSVVLVLINEHVSLKGMMLPYLLSECTLRLKKLKSRFETPVIKNKALLVVGE